MDWWEPLNLHCERAASRAFWAEPFNAWTNLAFPLAALLITPILIRIGQRIGRLRIPWELWTLNTILVLIGIGSFCYHTYAVKWAELFDVAAIFLWVVWFLVVALWRVLGWPWWATAAATAAFVVGSPAAANIFGYFVWAYTPTLIAGVGLGLYAMQAGRTGGRMLIAAMAVFGLSIAAACLDKPLCEVWPTGTHFVWHLLNSVALSLATVALAAMLASERVVAKA